MYKSKIGIVRLDNEDDFKEFFCGGKCGFYYFTEKRQEYFDSSDNIKDLEFPLFVKLKYKGADADCVGLGYGYAPVSKNEISKGYAQAEDTLNEFCKLLGIKKED